MKKIYLANPYGFSQAKDTLLPYLVNALECLSLEVWEPFARNNSVDLTPYQIATNDKRDVENCDALFAVLDGNPPDEGVMIELGIAIALKKDIFLYRGDVRKCTDSNEYPLNLMVFCGLPQDGWTNYYYTSMSELYDPTKALYQWAIKSSVQS